MPLGSRGSAIRSVSGRRVWDSRGRPTIEVEVVLEDGSLGRAIAPAGASRGTREAIDLRDGGTTLAGFDVQRAVAAVEGDIATALTGLDALDQSGVDAALVALDGTPNKARLGGNALFATSCATLHAAAASRRRPLWSYVATLCGTQPILPLPEIQIIGGGAHAGHRIDIQDLMVMVPGASSFAEAIEITSEVYHAAGDILRSRGKLAGVADEGGWWPLFDSNEEAIETVIAAIERTGETPGRRVVLSLDIAASQFGSAAGYRLALEGRTLDTGAMLEMLGGWLRKYPIAAIEDPLAEDDIDGMRAFSEAHGADVQIIGDDYLVTDPELTRRAIADGICNAVLIKVNQIGTFSEALKTFDTASRANWGTIVSARSGETEDVTISHLATGLGANQLKVGSFARSERMAKWNECLRIADEIGIEPGFAAGRALERGWWGRTHGRNIA